MVPTAPMPTPDALTITRALAWELVEWDHDKYFDRVNQELAPYRLGLYQIGSNTYCIGGANLTTQLAIRSVPGRNHGSALAPTHWNGNALAPAHWSVNALLRRALGYIHGLLDA